MSKLLNDNETSRIEAINDNVNDEQFVVGKRPREVRAYSTALKLADKFNNKNGLRFYYNIALKFSEDEIWKMYERSNKKGITSPGRYFTTLFNNKLVALGKR